MSDPNRASRRRSDTDRIDPETTSTNSPDPIVIKGRSVWGRLYHGETNANIVGRWKLWFAISGVLLLVGVAALATRGLNLGIDFTGGTIWKTAAGDATVAQVQEAMAELGYDDVQVQEVTQVSGGEEVRLIQVEAETSVEPSAATTKALDAAASALDDVRTTVPEPSRAAFDRAFGNLSEIDGPFEVDVPDELAEIQDEVDALPAALEEAADDAAKATVAADAAARIEAQVEALADLEDAERARLGRDVTERLSELTGTPVEQITVDTVGPSWGQQISEKARTALIVFMVAITLFITIRFEFKMALATIVALFHDLLMVVGVYALLALPVTPSTVVALLTMLGFSIYDGIVVFDRVDENTKLLTKRSRMTYADMANLSLNQVLMRSLNTSITTLLPILSVLIVGAFILGATTLEEFGLALFLGLLSGAYSSLFIATPLLALLKEREPRFRELRQQIAERGHGSVDLDDDVDDDPVKTAVLAGGHAPRPRKQGRKR